MARLPRIDVVGIPQHIVLRGVDRQPCFYRDIDRSLYLDVLADAATRYDVSVHAFVLMTNHVHLLASARALGALSAMMKLVGLRYVRRINGTYGRTGTLFEGRFRGSLVQSERYLLACMRYIELNPVRAHMVVAPEDYPWSSYRHHAGLEREHESRFRLLTPHGEFARLGTSSCERATAWRDLVRAGVAGDDLASIRAHVNRNRALGEPQFQERIAAMLGRRVDIVPRGRPWPTRILD
ncbi:MAG: transposase [Casimicrobiaceae bacterium]